MKLREIELPLAAFAKGLERAGAGASAAPLRLLIGFLSEFRDRTTVELSGRSRPPVMGSAIAPEGSKGPLWTQVVPLLEDLRDELIERRAAAQASGVGLLIELLRSDSGYLVAMLDRLRRVLTSAGSPRGIAEFVERLTSEIGTEAFEQTLSELTASRLKREDVVEIARAVYGGIPKGTSRKVAIGFIRKPHDARVSAKRGIDAMGGRSAA